MSRLNRRDLGVKSCELPLMIWVTEILLFVFHQLKLYPSQRSQACVYVSGNERKGVSGRRAEEG